MALKPSEWSVVVVGYWNRAILTPSGIAKRLFGLQEGTPVDVLVSVDTISPVIVKHDGMQVLADANRLLIQPSVLSFAELERAMKVAARAVAELPETPLAAAGFNVKYLSTESTPSLQQAITHDYDERLAEMFPVSGHSYQRSIKWRNGRINLVIQREGDGDYSLRLNFDLTSSETSRLKEWLQIPIGEVQTATTQIIHDFLGLNINEENDNAHPHGNTD